MKEEITFPARWEYRLFVDAGLIEPARQEIGAILAEKDEHAELAAGESSSSGRYLALRARAEVRSREEAGELARKLSAVPGVKFIL